MTEKYQAKIASLGGLEAIMSAMSTHKDHAEVQLQACHALGTFSAKDGIFGFLPFFSFRLFLTGMFCMLTHISHLHYCLVIL
jgi:hypothetical protein